MARNSKNKRTSGRRSGWWTGTVAAALLAACGVVSLAPAYGQPASKAADKAVDLAKMEKRDSIIFNNGNKVEGVILEESDTTIRFLLIVASLRSEVTYNKSDVLDVRRNEFAPSADTAKPEKDKADTKPQEMATAGASDADKMVDVKGKIIPAGTTRVYVVNLTGEFGRDVSKTPIKNIMDDLARTRPEIIVFLFNESFSHHQEEIPADFAQVGSENFITSAMIKAQEIDTLITPRLRDDPAFAYKPRVVAWIKKALGPAAFLPLVFHDIYFSTDGHLGGVGGLDTLLEGRGDEVVRQKQRSLRLAWVKGLGEQGGHDSRIVRAMCWGDYILSYRIVGGQAELYEGMPPNADWYLLKDDGSLNKDHADSMQDVVRMKGNDFLTLDSKLAFDIGFSKGTADTLDDLLSKMNASHNYSQMKTKSDAILKEWSSTISKSEKDVERLIRTYRGVEVKAPGQYEQRTAARGERIRYLQQIQSILRQYGEAINPERVGDPDNTILQLDVTIDRIKTEQQLDRRP